MNKILYSIGKGKLAALAIVLGLILGCAQVRVVKVPTASQYTHWTDKMQEKADRIPGFRYYLPRAFVNVFESFPVRTDVYFADGVVSPDGKYVIIKAIRGQNDLSKHFASPERTVLIPKRQIINPLPGKTGVRAQSEKESELPDSATKVPTGVSDEGKPEPAAPPKTGVLTQGVKNDNGAFAYQPLRGNFDLVYIHDFEEQYAISASAGLGNAQIAVNMGQGWSLQGFNSLTDNSELNKRIFDLIDTSIKAAKAAASASTGIPLVDLPPGVTDLVKPQSAKEDPVDGTPGTPVSLKISVIHYAAKGLYPVIKPRELQERLTSSEVRPLFLNLHKIFPRDPVWSSDYDPAAIGRAQKAIENETGNFTVPRYPYQFISFNTFRYIAVEAIRADAAPFSNLYDKTGTSGDPGDRQSVNAANIILEYLQRLTSGSPSASSTKQQAEVEQPGTQPPHLGTPATISQAERAFADNFKNKTISVGGADLLITQAVAGPNSTCRVTLEVTQQTDNDVTEAQLDEALKASAAALAGQMGITTPPNILKENYDEIQGQIKR